VDKSVEGIGKREPKDRMEKESGKSKEIKERSPQAATYAKLKKRGKWGIKNTPSHYRGPRENERLEKNE